MDLCDQLRDVRIVMVDPYCHLVLAWHGGHGIHAYQSDGREVAYWNVGDFAKNDADPRTVRASMKATIREAQRRGTQTYIDRS